MISDILTVAWKELREFLLQRGSVRATLTNMLLMMFVFGVVLPLQSGRGWVESPISLVAWAWMPLFLVTGMIADSFAGERERHTLETLLASRLSDRAILLGKMLAGIVYSLSLTILLLVVGLVTVNVSDWTGTLALYPPMTILGFLTFGTLGAALVAGIGVLVSLRAATVRQAAQTLSIGILLLVWVPVLAIQFLPASLSRSALDRLMSLDVRLLAPLLLVMLVVLDVAVLALALARFQRDRLILD
jgi:ABC-2 type transport system permease protein